MRLFLIVVTTGTLALSACEQTATAPPAGAATATAQAGASPPADSQLINGAQTRLNRFGYADVDASTLTRDQIIRLNRIDTIRKGRAEIRLEISAILGRSQ